MRWRSTTVRFALLVFLLQMLAAGALLAITGAVVRRQIEHDAAIQSDVLRDDLLASYAGGGIAGLTRAVEGHVAGTMAPGAVLLLVDRDGRRLAGNLAAWPAGFPTGGSYHAALLRRVRRPAAEAMRVRATPLAGGTRLLTGSVAEGERRIVGYLEGAAAVGIVLAALFAALAAWLAARLIVSRLAATIATLRAVQDGDLGRRVGEDASGDAFATLATAVNVTLDRVDVLVGELKIATDGLAHDLKSPLTRLRSALERAAVAVRDPVARQSVELALGEGERVLAIVETALRISRAEAGVGRDSFARVDLASELNDIAEIYGPVVEETGATITVDAPATIVLPVHRELLGQALGNLVDNALKYGTGPIVLRLRVAADAVTIAVDDRGAGIPAARREQALARFGRLDEARQEAGAGLGLALVGAVARLHGGTVALADAAPGLSVRLVLPVAAGAP